MQSFFKKVALLAFPFCKPFFGLFISNDLLSDMITSKKKILKVKKKKKFKLIKYNLIKSWKTLITLNGYKKWKTRGYFKLYFVQNFNLFRVQQLNFSRKLSSSNTYVN